VSALLVADGAEALGAALDLDLALPWDFTPHISSTFSAACRASQMVTCSTNGKVVKEIVKCSKATGMSEYCSHLSPVSDLTCKAYSQVGIEINMLWGCKHPG